jgi:hypothetical protein
LLLKFTTTKEKKSTAQDDRIIPESRRKYDISPQVKISRNVSAGTHKFKEIFQGFETVSAVRETFGEAKVMENLEKLTVEVFPKDGFMGVSDEDGHIFASQFYLNEGDDWSIYLDIVHELMHVKQFERGMDLFDQRYKYVDRPTEIEAYRVAVREARKIGMLESEIFSYLEVPWISREEHERLATACGVKFS